MSSPWRWLVAGLVAAALLLGLGWWLGHRSVTTSAADVQAWRDSTAVLLGEADAVHRAAVDSLLGVADSLERQAHRLAHQRNQATAEAGRWTAEADTLRAMLAWTEGRVDSLAIYPALVAAQDSTIDAQAGAITALSDALTLAEQSKSVLLEVITANDSRITALEQQLATAPKPERFRLRLLGVNTRLGLFAGVTPTGKPTTGFGVVITR